jgi:hypothetical protein
MNNTQYMFASDVNWHIYACTCTVLKGKDNARSHGACLDRRNANKGIEKKKQQLDVEFLSKTEKRKNIEIHMN